MSLYAHIIPYFFNVYFPYIHAILGLLSVWIFINAPKKGRFAFGFFVGLMWFYWTGLSFRFTPSPLLGFAAALGVGIGYGVVLWLMLWAQNRLIRGIFLALIGYIAIFGFDWFVPDALFAFSVFSVEKSAFVAIIAAVILARFRDFLRHKARNLIAFALLIFALDWRTESVEIPALGINLTQTNIAQNLKWNAPEMSRIIAGNLSLIEDSAQNGDKIVVLPETAFPMVLNAPYNAPLLEELRNLSEKITIVVGAQRVDSVGHYNSTFVFEKGEMRWADKVFLAPFGEYMPIPSAFARAFSRISGIQYAVFDKSAQQPRDIEIEGVKFRNAICYEATTRAIYADNPALMVLISNNAWFKPSIEAVLQLMLVKYYARAHKTIIFHSANGSKSGIITPNISFGFYENTGAGRF